MRVFFHANIDHGQAAAVWRCRDLFKAKYDISLEQNEPFGKSPEPDLWLLHTQIDIWHQAICIGDAPIAILERIDGPQLTGPVRANIDNPRIRAVIKNTMYRDWGAYNENPWRQHEATCRPGMKFTDVRDPISAESAAKLKLGFSFAAYPHMDSIRAAEPYELSHARPYAGHFAGTVDYGPELPWLNSHRQAAVAALSNTHGPNIAFSDRAMQFPAYFASMREAEFVISPWGLGEPCYRDFEAVLSGCHVVKPDTRYIVTVPYDFYRIPQIERCIVRPGYSNLGDVIANVQRVPIGDRIQWAAYVAGQNSTENIARRLARIFRDAVK